MSWVYVCKTRVFILGYMVELEVMGCCVWIMDCVWYMSWVYVVDCTWVAYVQKFSVMWEGFYVGRVMWCKCALWVVCVRGCTNASLTNVCAVDWKQWLKDWGRGDGVVDKRTCQACLTCWVLSPEMNVVDYTPAIPVFMNTGQSSGSLWAS